jgi:isopentenyl-diphosphate delta-isomerase
MPDPTPHEMVDVVDEENTVLYQVTKSEAHTKGLLHRTVIAELKNSCGQWIMVKQAADRQDAGQYVSPMGGHVTAGETEEEAMTREVLEEMGLTDFKYRYVGKAIYRRTVLGRDEHHYFILFETFSDAEPHISHESVGYKSFTEEELKRTLKERPEEFGAAFHFVVKAFYPALLLD